MIAHLHSAFHEPNTRIYRVVQSTVWALILLSIAFLVAEALLPEDSAARPILGAIDRVVLTIFALEIVLRVGSFRPPALRVFQRPAVTSVHSLHVKDVPVLFTGDATVHPAFPPIDCGFGIIQRTPGTHRQTNYVVGIIEIELLRKRMRQQQEEHAARR